MVMILAVAALLIATETTAAVRLPTLFTDHMVLQRSRPIPVWGWATPGRTISVQIGARQAQATVGADSTWQLTLSPLQAGGPHELVVEGDGRVVVRDVLVGEVWVGSGQSNMQWTVANSNDADAEIAAADFPRIRLFQVPRTTASTARTAAAAAWQVCSPSSVAGYSAVAYFFGRRLHDDLQVPIFEAALHPKSFLSLDGADHLLRDDGDARYAGNVIAAWSLRFASLVESDGLSPNTATDEAGVTVSIGRDRYRADIQAAGHALVADEPVSSGGGDLGPGPYDLLLAALGSCTAMTLRMYADHKGWDLAGVQVHLQHERIHASDSRDCQESQTRESRVDVVNREIELAGDLSTEQRERLVEIADRCPVHRTLHGELQVRTRLREEGKPTQASPEKT